MSDSKTYQFVIKDFTPETMPLSRLVEYYALLNKMFGDIEGVHLVSINKGSHKNLLKIDGRAEDKFFSRVDGVRQGTASKPVLAARDGINVLVSEDNTSADFISDLGEKVIQFKASGVEAAKRIRIRDACDFVGKLYHLSGKDSSKVSIRIDTKEYGSVAGIVCESMARDLRKYTLDFVRLTGRGDWSKVGDGPWQVSNFEVEGFELVKKTSFRAAVDDIRNLAIKWEDNPLGFLERLEEENGAIQ
ncbi:MAG: hypothetical protein GQ535_00805 [Rhodobacteraceae bacterium]|nr:hypothetical protein [Paracoccaceae bacterium]